MPAAKIVAEHGDGWCSEAIIFGGDCATPCGFDAKGWKVVSRDHSCHGAFRAQLSRRYVYGKTIDIGGQASEDICVVAILQVAGIGVGPPIRFTPRLAPTNSHDFARTPDGKRSK